MSNTHVFVESRIAARRAEADASRLVASSRLADIRRPGHHHGMAFVAALVARLAKNRVARPEHSQCVVVP